MNLFKIKDFIKQKIKKRLVHFYSLAGYDFLEYDETIDFLSDNVIYKSQNASLKIPELSSFNGVRSAFFEDSKKIDFDNDLVWKLTQDKKIESLVVHNSGSVLINKEKYLRLDMNVGQDLAEFNFITITEERPLIVPWSHRWGTYYDYFIFVVTKLCRIEQALEKETWKQSVIYYPFLKNIYEQQILDYFDLRKDQLLHLSRGKKIKVKGKLILANNQNWYYPRPKEIELLRNKFLPSNSNKDVVSKRIYIIRKGVRAIKNEYEVKYLLKDFGFQPVILEDMTLREQILLFKNCEVVVGPHGAGFTNILWSSPGTHLVEFFKEGYFPPHFYYLAHVLDLKYHCIVEEGDPNEDHKNRYLNMTVDVKLLEELLVRIIRSIE